MSAPADSGVNILLQTAGRGYEPLGAGLFRGLIPAGTVFGSSNPGGSDTLQSVLHRDTRYVAPDLKGLNKCIITAGTVPVWSGRVRATPTSRGADTTVTLTGEGIYASLNDNPLDRTYIVNDMSKWVDSRSLPSVNLTTWMQGGTVAVDQDAISIGIPPGTIWLNGTGLGVTLDLGPNATAAALSFDWTCSNNLGTGVQFYIRTSSNQDGIAATTMSPLNGVDPYKNPTGAGTQNENGTFANPQRYVQMFIYNGNGAAFTTGSTINWWIHITGIRVFAKTAYQTAGVPILTASAVIKDVLSTQCPQVSTDQSGIQATTFALPAYTTGGRRAPTDVVNDVNGYHDYQFLLSNDPIPKPIFRPVPTVPTWTVGEGDLVQIDDTGANDTTDLLNFTAVAFTTANGYEREVIANTDPLYSAIMARSPLGYFRLNDAIPIAGGGTGPLFAQDSSGRNLSGQYATYSSLAYQQPGPRAASKSIRFSGGAGAYVINFNDDTATPSGTAGETKVGDVFTFQCWYKRTAASGGASACIFSGGPNNHVVYFDASDHFAYGQDGVGVSFTSTATFADTSSWHHCVISKNGATIVAYIDGVVVPGTVVNHTVGATATNTIIGIDYNNTVPFLGYLSEVAWFASAWSAADVAAVYNAMGASTIVNAVDAQGVQKGRVLQPTSRMAASSAYQYCSTYLAAHATSPAKGTITAIHSIRRYSDGARVPIYFVQAGDAVLIENVYNPDTQQRGRIVIVQKTSIDVDAQTITLTIDTRKDYTDALLERLGVVVR